MDYKEAISYLESFIDYERFPFFDYKQSLKLDRMRRLVERLGNPHKDLKCIHITGTKGKGSTSAMVMSILKAAGFRVGLYTSPHLVSFRERIRINDVLINEEELSGLLSRIRPIIDSIDKTSSDYPTFFEVYTAIAFLYFKERKVDFCVLEVGLGGRLDATNIIERPLCCGITQISLEHIQKLGNTLREIAAEKAGIIKEGSICVSSSQDASAIEVIQKTCRERNSKLYEAGKDLRFRRERNQVFSVKGIFQEYPFLKVGLIGDHQFMNGLTAIGLIESLRFHDIIISEAAIQTGLKDVRWPGRVQVLRENPYILLDGAQNKASAAALREAIKRYFNYNKLILILGISKDKDIKGICEELAPVSDEIILTRADLLRAEEPAVIKKFIDVGARHAVPLHLTDNVNEAMSAAERIANPSDLILVTGSFFVLGEVLKAQMSADVIASG